MTQKNRWQIALAGLTLTLLACEDSITGIPVPVADFEMAQSAALSTGACLPPAAGLISWWPGEGIGDERFDDIAPPIDETVDPDANHIAFVSFGVGVENHHGDGHGDGGRADPDGSGVHGPAGITVGFAPVGKVGQAFSFTPEGGARLRDLASVEFLEVVDAPDLQPANFTIDLWAMRTGDGQNDLDGFGSSLIQKTILDGSVQNAGLSYGILWDKAGNKIKAVVNGFGNVLEGKVPASSDGWVHIALTADGTTAKLYLNGVPVDDISKASGTPIEYGVGSVVIGSASEWGRLHDFPRGFHGLIDEVDIYDSALSPIEIAGIHGAGSAGKCIVTDNTAPEIVVLEGGEINEGGTFTSAGSFTDPDSDPWIVTVDYGDGTVDDATLDGQNFFLSHKYVDNGTYVVTLKVDDQEADPVMAIAEVIVNNVAPVIQLGPDAREILESEGATYESSVMFIDPGADVWTVTIDYGDGTVESQTVDGTVDTWTPGPITVQLSHPYEANEACSPYTVTVAVEDNDGGEDSGSAQVTFVHQISVSRASVKLDRRGRESRDRFDVSGRLPRSLIECLDPTDVVSINLDGIVLDIPAESLRRSNRWWQRKWFFTGRGRNPIRKLELHDNGRFNIRARSSDLRDAQSRR